MRLQKCPLDDGEHALWKCEKFKKLSITEWSEAVKHANLCFKCLTENIKTSARDCKSKLKCKIDGCERNHNCMLYSTQSVTHELIQSPDQISENSLANESAWSVKRVLHVESGDVLSKRCAYNQNLSKLKRHHLLSNFDR